MGSASLCEQLVCGLGLLYPRVAFDDVPFDCLLCGMLIMPNTNDSYASICREARNHGRAAIGLPSCHAAFDVPSKSSSVTRSWWSPSANGANAPFMLVTFLKFCQELSKSILCCRVFASLLTFPVNAMTLVIVHCSLAMNPENGSGLGSCCEGSHGH